MSLLERILKLMEINGLNAARFTSIIGISGSSFSDWKKGKGSPSLETVVKIADYFGVSIDYLVYGNKKENAIDRELLNKYHSLPSELQEKLMGYLDGMIAALPRQQQNEERLSG